MKELSKKIQEQVKDLDKGKLGVEDLEQLVDDARELYEKLLIVKYKAYEKFGDPAESKEEESIVEEPVSEVKEEAVVEEENVIEETTAEEEVVEESVPFDFTSEVEDEQPAFDFSASEEIEDTSAGLSVQEQEAPAEEETFPVDEDIKNTAPKEEETTETETFPEAANTKAGSSDIFKDSHVEKHEPEDSGSLNQQLADDGQSLRKKLQNSPVADLKSEISIAKKFEYITFMFDGKNEIYEEAINTLNNCSDGEEAKIKLNEYSSKYNWDLENKSIIKFVELVERRYL